MIEEKPVAKSQKFQKVEQKLNLLAQSKLQNLSQNGFRFAEDRLNCIQKKLVQQIASNQKIIRDYRLKLRSFWDQFEETQEKYQTSMRDRSAEIISFRQQLQKIVTEQREGRTEKEKWSQDYYQEKIEKTEKQVELLKEDRNYDISELNDRLIKIIPEEKAVILQANRVINVLLDKKMDGVSKECNEFRQSIRKELEKGEKSQRKIVEHLKGVVSEIKTILSDEKLTRQKNRDRLVAMLKEATKNISMK